MPTFLEAFGIAPPDGVTGKSLLPLLADEEATIHEALLFGYFGGAVNLTDDRYSYFRYPDNVLDQELYQYTLMPNHMRRPFTMEELKRAELIEGLSYARGVPVLRVPVIDSSPWYNSHGPRVMEDTRTAIYDTRKDPNQENPLLDSELEGDLAAAMTKLLEANDAPPEVFRRLHLR